MEPALALGGLVHDVIESLSTIPVEERFLVSPIKKFDTLWEKISGKMGGFKTKEQETEFRDRGRAMIQRVVDSPGPLLNKAIKIKGDLPQYLFSDKEDIILCGKIDWLEYMPETDSVHVIDFKTGKHEEREDSLQLPIYYLLATNTQGRPVTKMSYWYLNSSDTPAEVPLPDSESAKESLLKIGQRIKLARQLEHFKCETNGCRYCFGLDQIAHGKGELVGTSSYGQDIYVLF